MAKKILLFSLLGLFALGTGCSKDDDPTYDDGIYNPERKISEIYGEYLYPGETSDGPILEQGWFWVGDRLSGIVNSEAEELDVAMSFIYEGNRIVSMGNDYETYRFFYDGSALTSIDVYSRGILFVNLKVTARRGKHITGLEMTGAGGTKAATETVTRPDRSPLAGFFPEGLLRAIEEFQASPAGTKAVRTSNRMISLTYNGDNLVEMVLTSDYSTQTYRYTHDTKKNPYYDLWFSGSFIFPSRNNVLTETRTSVYQYEDEDPEEYTDVSSFRYEYDGDDWPVKSIEETDWSTDIRYFVYLGQPSPF